MRHIINCYHNWHIDAILLLATIALVLVSSEGLQVNIIGTLLLIADFFLARKWHAQGRLNELDNITE